MNVYIRFWAKQNLKFKQKKKWEWVRRAEWNTIEAEKKRNEMQSNGEIDGTRKQHWWDCWRVTTSVLTSSRKNVLISWQNYNKRKLEIRDNLVSAHSNTYFFVCARASASFSFTCAEWQRRTNINKTTTTVQVNKIFNTIMKRTNSKTKREWCSIKMTLSSSMERQKMRIARIENVRWDLGQCVRISRKIEWKM